MPVLARAWQMLLKGHEEVRGAPPGRSPPPTWCWCGLPMPPICRPPPILPGAWPMASERRTARRNPPPAPVAARRASPRRPSVAATPVARLEPAPRATDPPCHGVRNSFDGRGGARRSASAILKLKHALLEQVRLVRFQPGHLEINPLAARRRRELGQELMRKLKAWTGRVWIVAVSDEEGAEPLGAQRRAREAQRDRAHPRAPAGQAGAASTFPTRASPRCGR